MKATLLVLVFALLAVGAYAQEAASSPAIMTPPADNLKKPIIFAPAPAANSTDADAPLTGAAPANLKKAVVTENLYGGAIEFVKGRDHHGCPCRKQLPEKFRYDTQFKPEKKARKHHCGCGKKPAPKPEDALPPVIAQLRPRHKKHKKVAAAPCAKPVAAPAPAQIAPEYYPKKVKKVAAAPCAKPVAAAKPATVAPEFYPTRAERRARRKARKAKKAAAKKL